jgi:signal transduction histidine kinase
VRIFARIALALAATLAMPAVVTDGWAQARSSRTVLVVTWGPEEFPATPIVNAAIREALTEDSDLSIDFFTEYLESDLFPPEQASQALANYIREKYRGRRIDLVIAIADAALSFVLEYRADLFPGAPIVYSGLAPPPAASLHADGGLTAVLRGTPYRETLKLALTLHPSTEQVFVVARTQASQTLESLRAEFDDFSRHVKLTYIHDQTVPELLATLRTIPRRSLVLYAAYSTSTPSTATDRQALVDQIGRAAPVPTYGTNEDFVGFGVVGGMLRSRRETAVRVGEMARQILNGTRPEDVPIEDARLVPIFDWRLIRRWGIDPSRLPPGSEIRYRVPSVWESYRTYIVSTLVVIAAQLLLIGGLLTQRARRRRAEETVRTREATLRTSYERIRQLAGRLINAQEAARAQIARDLHDDVCQQLVGVSMDVTRLERSSGRIQDRQAQRALSDLRQRALGVVEGVRRLSHDLHPASLQLVGLATALRSHCVEVEKRHDVQISFSACPDLTQPHPDVELCLFRIAQEALRNGAVHGQARRLEVAVARSSEHIELTVRDDGHGFDLEVVRQDGSGLGLVSMEERAHMIGGEVRIVTGIGRGTTVHVRVPASGERNSDNEHVHVRAQAFAVDASERSIERI